jgi:hypothetical protein
MIASDYMDGAERIDGRWIDKRTGKQTYPSWQKRNARKVIHPRGIRPPNPSDERLRIQLSHWMHQMNYDWVRGVKKDVMVRGIQDITGMGFNPAWRKLKYLWRCGLVRRTGSLDSRSGRPKFQLWHEVRGE